MARITPKRGEGALGFALRASLACGYDHPYWLSNEPDRKPGNWARLFRRADAAFVLQSVGLPAARASELSAVGTDLSKSYSLAEGRSVNALLLNREQPKVCPECLVNAPYLHGHWELRLWTACPIHACAMETRCLDCGGEHGWGRKRLDGGCKLSRPHTLSWAHGAPKTSVDLVRCVARASGYEAPLPSSKLSSLIGHLKLRELSMLIHRLAAVVQADGREKIMLKSTWTPSPTEAGAAMQDAAEFLARWPDSLHEVLETHRLATVGCGRPVSPNFGFFRSRFLKLFYQPQFAFVRSAALTRIKERYSSMLPPRPRRSSPTRRRTIDAGEGFLGPAAVGSLLGLSAQCVRRYLQSGQLPGSIVLVKGRSLHAIRREDVDAAYRRERLGQDQETACRDAGALGLGDAADLLGVGWEGARNLRDSGLLGEQSVSVHFKNFYSRSVIEKLLGDLAGKAGHVPHAHSSNSTAGQSSTPRPLTFFASGADRSVSELVGAALQGGVQPSYIFAGKIGLQRFGYSREAWDEILAELNPGSLTQQQVADTLGCTPLTVRTLLRAGVLTTVGGEGTDRLGSGKPQRISERSVFGLSSRLISTSGLSQMTGLHPNGLRPYLVGTGLQPEFRLGTAETTYWRRDFIIPALVRQGLVVRLVA